MSRYHFAFYRSLSHYTTCDASDLDILREAIAFNEARQITGFLLRTGQIFLQYIEGAEADIHELLGKIASDPRHTAMEILHRGETEARCFADWSMGYAWETESDFSGRIGITDLRGGVLPIIPVRQALQQHASAEVHRAPPQ